MTMTPIGALYHGAETCPKSVAFIGGNDVWTYERLVAEVERLTRGFIQRGLRPGDRVALHMANVPELVVAYYACFRMGAIAAPMNIRFKAAELRPLLQRLRPALYIGQADLYGAVAAIDTPILASSARFIVGDTVEDPRAQPWTSLFGNTSGEPVPAMPNARAPAILLTTSGTTGQPKFVIHTQLSLSEAANSLGHLVLDGKHISIVTVPMVHSSGLFTFLACIRHDVPMVLLERFDPDAVLDAIERSRATLIVGLPFMFVAMLERQRARARNVYSLRTCITGGDVCPPQLQDKFPYFFGTPLRSLWAATEAVGSLSYGLAPGPVSRIAKGAQVRLVDDSGVQVPRGKVGELVLRGPNVTIGYWAGPDLIENALKDGWFHTGDLMRQDEKGDLWFVSRKKDLIIRGGSNISPVEVERALTSHPAVLDAAVVGVPDTELGQRVAGFVQLASDAQNVSLEEILASVTVQLADYKVPENLKVVGEIPRNTLGKIDRKLLLAMTSAREDSEAAAIFSRPSRIDVAPAIKLHRRRGTFR
jgi:long-chain acyl-CoA synthetase